MNARKARGIILLCSPNDYIIEVLHDDWGRAQRDTSFSSCIAETDRSKWQLFVEAIARDHFTFGWELHVDQTLVTFAGFESAAGWLLLGSEEPALLERLGQELVGMNNEMVGALRAAHKEQLLSNRKANSPLEDFAKLTNELTSLHREISKRVRDLEQINRDYEIKQTAMQDLARQREELLNQLVHDLRSPLTSVNGAVRLALSGVLGPLDDTAMEVLTLAKEGCDRLTEMIANILDTAKSEAGRLEYAYGEVHLKELAEKVARTFTTRALERQVSLRISGSDDIYFLADAQLSRRVLENYVSNALKFSPPGRTISITYVALGPIVRVCVADEGPGLTSEQQQLLFNKYVQIERRGMSTGIGLSFCKEVVQAMGGRVGVNSSHGKGATFWFELPRSSRN